MIQRTDCAARDSTKPNRQGDGPIAGSKTPNPWPNLDSITTDFSDHQKSWRRTLCMVRLWLIWINLEHYTNETDKALKTIFMKALHNSLSPKFLVTNWCSEYSWQVSNHHSRWHRLIKKGSKTSHLTNLSLLFKSLDTRCKLRIVSGICYF